MTAGDGTTQRLPVLVGDQVVYVEVERDDGEEVGFRAASLEEFTAALGTVARGVAAGVEEQVRELRPSRIAMEIGCEAAMESGRLTAVLVRGDAAATVKLTIEWAPGAPAQGTPTTAEP